jgi:hypothetical protein
LSMSNSQYKKKKKKTQCHPSFFFLFFSY